VNAANEAKKRKEKTMPFGINLIRSQILDQAAQANANENECLPAVAVCKTRSKEMGPPEF